MAKKAQGLPDVVNPHFDTVLVEQSDDRLAEVEIAKRTGNAFVSVGTAGSEIVPQEVAEHIAYEKSLQNTTIGPKGTPIAAHREEWLNAIDEDESYIEVTNEEKAQAHSDYSAELVRRQQEQEEADRARLKNDPDAIAKEIQERQARLTEDYDKAMNEWNEARREKLHNAPSVLEVVDELVNVVTPADLVNKSLDERIKQYEKVVTIPDALERPAEEALTVKDHIISTEEKYADFAEGGNLSPVEQEAQVEEAEQEEPVSPKASKVSAKGADKDAGTLEPNHG